VECWLECLVAGSAVHEDFFAGDEEGFVAGQEFGDVRDVLARVSGFRDCARAENLIHAGHAACRYLLRMPPRCWCRRTSRGLICAGSAIGDGSGRNGRAFATHVSLNSANGSSVACFERAVQTGLRSFAIPAQSFLDEYQKLLRSKWNLFRRHKVHYATLWLYRFLVRSRCVEGNCDTQIGINRGDRGRRRGRRGQVTPGANGPIIHGRLSAPRLPPDQTVDQPPPVCRVVRRSTMVLPGETPVSRCLLRHN
jgi:hypothetical protein